jgi:cyclopropane fatty-acyl-phospholipid synthase-like methyltransferase
MKRGESEKTLFSDLEWINTPPSPFEFYTARELWTDEHTSAQMLSFHLDENVDRSSRKATFIDESVEWLVKRLGIAGGTSVADFGCGPGLYASRLAGRGANVTGIDFSARSIEYAKDQARAAGHAINYLNHDYLGFDTADRFEVILMIFCDFCALSPAQRQTMLMKFHSFLKPGGRVVLDVHSLAAFEQCRESSRYEMNLLDGFWSPEPYYGFLNTFKYEEVKVTLDKYTIVERTKIRTVYNWLQYFSVESLKEEFRQAGLAIEDVYSDVAGKPYDLGSLEVAVVAKKALEVEAMGA